ncbi:MAG: hypothetical protein Q8R28_05465 [Dehalococcoidia bacterium]|nr:hypothetical protein [Dehalococcoidia bacterium]
MPRKSRYLTIPLRLPVGSQPAPATLDSEFMSAAPTINVKSIAHRHLTLIELRFILWAKMNGGEYRDMAKTLGRGVGTVWEAVNTANKDPDAFLRCGFVQKVVLGSDAAAERWICRACHAVFDHPLPACDHAWLHVFDQETLMRPSAGVVTSNKRVRIAPS